MDAAGQAGGGHSLRLSTKSRALRHTPRFGDANLRVTRRRKDTFKSTLKYTKVLESPAASETKTGGHEHVINMCEVRRWPPFYSNVSNS